MVLLSNSGKPKTMTKTYTIPTGHHSGGPYKPRLLRSVMAIDFKVFFCHNCAYELGNEDQKDINKLLGFSASPLDHHHENSIRIGWRWNEKDQEIELYAYCYQERLRTCYQIGSVRLMETALIQIERDPYNRHRWHFRLWSSDGGCVSLPLFAGPVTGWLLFPYFGGNRPAPHSMDIEIQDLTIKQVPFMKIPNPSELKIAPALVVGFVVPGTLVVTIIDFLTEKSPAGYAFAIMLFLALAAYIYLLVAAWKEQPETEEPE